MKQTIYPIILTTLLTYFLTINFGCTKDEITNTIIQQDTIVQHDTTFINYGTIEEYNSGSNSELISSLRVQKTHTWAKGGVIYALQVSDLKKGDIIFATTQCEFTNRNDYPAGLYTQLVLADNPSYLPDDSGIIEVSESNGTNITETMVHYTATQFGTYQCTSDIGTVWVNFVAYAQATPADDNDFITVEQDYGRLSLIIYRK